MEEKTKIIKRNDLILFLGIVLIAAAAIFIMYRLKSEGSRVVITVDGKEYKNLDLKEDTELTIEGKDGTYNKVIIKDGEVSMTEANCPDKICVKHSKIHYNGETIVCLPHKVVVKIESKEESDVDITVR